MGFKTGLTVGIADRVEDNVAERVNFARLASLNLLFVLIGPPLVGRGGAQVPGTATMVVFNPMWVWVA